MFLGAFVVAVSVAGRDAAYVFLHPPPLSLILGERAWTSMLHIRIPRGCFIFLAKKIMIGVF